MKTIQLFIGLLFCVIGMHAQTYYYNETKTFKEKKYTYQCDVNDSTKMVTLYNVDDEMTYIDLVNEQRAKLYLRTEDNPEEYVESVWNEPQYNFFVHDQFTKAQKQRLQGYKLGIIMCMRVEDGKTIEVNFNFLSDEPFATIPLSVYRKLEKKLKNLDGVV
ncbi:MAG: DUF5043 domain-containing protein [Dysgonomonas sp.]